MCLCVCVCVHSLEVWREDHRGQKHGPFFDLAPKAEDGVLLESLTDVQDVLVLEGDEADFLQAPSTGLLYETYHWLGGGREGVGGSKTMRGRGKCH